MLDGANNPQRSSKELIVPNRCMISTSSVFFTGTITVWLSMIHTLWKVFLTGLAAGASSPSAAPVLSGVGVVSAAGVVSCARRLVCCRNRQQVRHVAATSRRLVLFMIDFIVFVF